MNLSYANAARNIGEAEHPERWENLGFAICPHLGNTGLRTPVFIGQHGADAGAGGTYPYVTKLGTNPWVQGHYGPAIYHDGSNTTTSGLRVNSTAGNQRTMALWLRFRWVSANIGNIMLSWGSSFKSLTLTSTGMLLRVDTAGLSLSVTYSYSWTNTKWHTALIYANLAAGNPGGFLQVDGDHVDTGGTLSSHWSTLGTGALGAFGGWSIGGGGGGAYAKFEYDFAGAWFGQRFTPFCWGTDPLRLFEPRRATSLMLQLGGAAPSSGDTTDAFLISDTHLATATTPAVTSDASLIAETQAPLATVTATTSDAILLTDAQAPLATVAVATTDAVLISDTQIGATSSAETVDAVLISDVFSAAATVPAVTVDASQVSGTIAALAVAPVTTSDAAMIADAIAVTAAAAATTVGTVLVSDSHTVIATAAAVVTNAMLASDVAVGVGTYDSSLLLGDIYIFPAVEGTVTIYAGILGEASCNST